MTTNASYPLRIVIADDHELYRDGFKLLLKKQAKGLVEVVGEAANGIELLEVVSKKKPQVVITDVRMPKMDGMLACRKIKQQFSNTGVIAISTFDEDSLIYDMFEAGANGYLFKNSGKEEILSAIETVSVGENYYSSITSLSLLKKLAPSKFNRQLAKQVQFTEKEINIIKLICQQLTTKEIASDLDLNRRTVEDYSASIKEKTGAKNLVGIALYAVKKGIVSLNDL